MDRVKHEWFNLHMGFRKWVKQCGLAIFTVFGIIVRRLLFRF